MIETLNALLDTPVLLLAILLVGGVFGIAVEKFFSAQDRARKRAYWQGRNAAKQRGGKPPLAPVPVGMGEPEPKRVDFVLMEEKCQARHALEYQGNGHHQGSAAARDAVKKEALRKAGVGYHEIVAGHTTPGDLRVLVEKLVPARAERMA